MLTAAQARDQRAKLSREIRAAEKTQNRRKLLALRERVREVARERSSAIRAARRACARRTQAIPTLKEAAAMLRAARAQAKETCGKERAKARGLRDAVARARAERNAEAKFQRDMRRIEGQHKERAKEAKRATAKERRGESDDEVRGNIPPDLVPLFERVKRQIKGSARMTRTEAFLAYAHDHPDEELRAIEERTEEMIRALERGERPPRRSNAKKKDKGAQRELFMPQTGQLEIVPSHEQRMLKEKKTSAAERTIPMFGNPKDTRPPKKWWRHCLSAVRAHSHGRVSSVRAVCGAAWWKMPEHQRAAIVRQMVRSKNPRAMAGAHALSLAEARRHGDKECLCALRRAAREKRNGRRKNPPRELVSLVYEEQKPGDDEPYEYEHEFSGDRPELHMRGGALQIEGGSYRTKNGWIWG